MLYELMDQQYFSYVRTRERDTNKFVHLKTKNNSKIKKQKKRGTDLTVLLR